MHPDRTNLSDVTFSQQVTDIAGTWAKTPLQTHNMANTGYLGAGQ
jgi:hypothetical protein